MITFIATTYNIAPYVGKCLDSLAAVARPGDEVIVIDDGSTDKTTQIVKDYATNGTFAEGVDIQTFLLGTNTPGGVGIGANIGLDNATRDTVFFVDGDDWMDAGGFNAARDYWERHAFDILFTNYVEWDEESETAKNPADHSRWAQFPGHAVANVDKHVAIPFIAVPWRKFYRRAFLEEHKIRFPEGDFFFEDNPFHWAVCLAAKQIGFFNQITCYHRVKRPGQTMVSAGIELAAFFTHFNTIWAMVPKHDQALKVQAARWLLAQMSWHRHRLSRDAYIPYFRRAADALNKIDAATWNGPLQEHEGDRVVFALSERLRSGDVWGVIDHMLLRGAHESINTLARIEEKLDDLELRIDTLERETSGARRHVEALTAAQKIRSVRKLLSDMQGKAPSKGD